MVGETIIASSGLNNIQFHASGMVVRTPLPPEQRAKTFSKITEEYRGIGFDHLGLLFELRTPMQQIEFAMLLAEAGVDTPAYTIDSEGTIYYEYIEGQTLDAELQGRHYDAIPDALNTLFRAHTQGLVIGDRWAKNTVVRTNGQPVEIDFDVNLSGPAEAAQAFELAQTLFHILHFAENPDSAFPLLWAHLNQPTVRRLYNQLLVEELVKTQAKYFLGLQYYEGSGTSKTYDAVGRLFTPTRELRVA